MNSGAATAGTGRRLGPGKLSNLQTRVLSALVLLPIALGAIWAGGVWFELFVLAFALVGTHEWLRLVDDQGSRLVRAAGIAAAAVVMAAAMLASYPLALALLAGLTIALYALARWRHRPEAPLVALGLPYLILACIALIWLREYQSAGLGLILFLLLAVWATDIGAYAFGRLIGGPLLARRISPKKTWAGLIGGAVSAAIAGVLVAALYPSETLPDAAVPVGALSAALVSMVLAVVAQSGDLFESWVKRRFGVKDSGAIIPGHGGVLDRVDGVLIAAPAFAILVMVAWG